MYRRALLGTAGMAGIAGAGSVLYRAAPAFWNQFGKELGRSVDPAPAHPAPQSWPDRGLYASWLGHSTVLLKVDGTTIITDPVFSDRVGLNFGPVTLGLKRLVAPAVKPRQLPKIDVVLVSHAHMDHLDLPSVRFLEDRQTSVITATQTGDLFRANRYRQLRELRWGETAAIGSLQIRALEVKHWGARMRTDTYRGYNGYLIEAGRYRILFAGDTAITSVFRGVKTARPIDLAIMPVGAYNPWIHAHCTPEQAWQMGNDAGAEFFIPVHHQTFSLSREPLLEPIERFYKSAGRNPERVAIDRIGKEFKLS